MLEEGVNVVEFESGSSNSVSLGAELQGKACVRSAPGTALGWKFLSHV